MAKTVKMKIFIITIIAVSVIIWWMVDGERKLRKDD